MRLSNGYEVPNICLGTDTVSPSMYSNNIFSMFFKRICLWGYSIVFRKKIWKKSYKIEKVIKKSISQNCIFFDTSRAYGGSERMLGYNLKKYKRNEYFICTKLCNKDQLSGKSARDALIESLNQLGVDYVDLYLIHWPIPGSWIDYWKQLEDLYDAGLCKAIGVSNCKIHHFEELKQHARIMPMVNEIEVHPLLTEEELCEYCSKNDIKIMAYTSTARLDFRLKNSKKLNLLCKKYKKDLSQLIIRWHIQNKRIPIFNTTSLKHLKSNLNVFDFIIDENDMKIISSMNINSRTRYDSDNCEFDIL